MSDYTANRIMIRGNQGELVYARHVLHDMDFNKIVPRPETLTVECGSINCDADLAFLYTIYGDDSAKSIQNGKNPQMINIIYPTWQKNYAKAIQKFKENVITDPDIGHPFGPESNDISYLWKEDHADVADDCNGAEFDISDGNITVVSDSEAGDSKCLKSCADLAALGRIRYINYLKYGHTDWYEWSCEKWGVKWNAVYPEVETGDDFVSYGFGTPWCMPDGIFHVFEKLLSPTSLEVIWAFAFTRRGYDCGYFMKKSNENKFVYTDKEGDIEFVNRVWGE